jgi:hypothetical protein
VRREEVHEAAIVAGGHAEQLLWLAPTCQVGVEHLPPSMRSEAVLASPVVDRRRQTADDLSTRSSSTALRSGIMSVRCSWPGTSRAHDLRDLLRRGLRESKGRYKALLKLFAQPVKEILEELAGGDHLRQVRTVAVITRTSTFVWGESESDGNARSGSTNMERSNVQSHPRVAICN